MDKGIAIIHQELNLIPYLTVYENIFLGRELKLSSGRLDKKAMIEESKKLFERLNVIKAVKALKGEKVDSNIPVELKLITKQI